MTVYRGTRTKADLLQSARPDIITSTARKVANNTLEYDLEDGSRAIQHQDTVIVIKQTDGTIILNSGGWRTYTTKERINRYLPAGVHLYQENHEWILEVRKNSSPERIALFIDDIRIRPDKTFVFPDGTKNELAKRKATKKLIKNYTKKLREHIKENGVPRRDTGDCWDCMFQIQAPETWKPSTTHLQSHLEEEYIHGSLIWLALEWRSYKDPNFIIHVNPGDGDTIVRTVRAYFNRKMGIA